MDLEHQAIARLQEAARLSEFYYQSPLLLTVSGGKDSEVCLELCRQAKIPFEALHSLTTADAPETVYHIQKTFRQLELEGVKTKIVQPVYKGKPASMWSLIPQKCLPPLRTQRWCCQILKEGNGKNRCIVLGVRRTESYGRSDSGIAEISGKTRAAKQVFDFDNGDERIFAPCQMKATIKIHPIVDWTDYDVWSFLREAHIPINPCYSMGLHRVGCIACPMASPRERAMEFRIWPKYENLYRKAFGRMLEHRRNIGKVTRWRTADDVYRWWMEDKNLDGQLDFFGGEVGAYET